LFALGIHGLRIDAAKHFPPADLRAVLIKAAQSANVRIENTDINPNGARQVLVYQEFIGTPPHTTAAYANGKVSEFEYGRKLAEKFLAGELGVLNHPVPFGERWELQPSIVSIAFLDNHDNQRGHGGGGQTMKDIRNNLTAYTLANIFMLAWPYGYPNVMSSYRFGSGEIWFHDQHAEQDITSVVNMPVRDDFLGPPHTGIHKHTLQSVDYSDADSWRTRSVWINEGGIRRNTCFDSGSKWMCEHRWRPIANMVGFRNAVNANWDPVANWWSNGHGRIAFGRGSLGFVLINGESGGDPRTFGPEGNAWIQTGLPEGRYCDIIHSNPTADKTRCITENGQNVVPIRVFGDGKGNIPVPSMDAVALHFEARLANQ
jgi:alpha-amylase